VDIDPLAKTAQSPVLPADELADRLAEIAKQALIERRLPELERILDELRRTGARPELVERIGGLAALGRGAKAEALRQLHAASEAEQPPARRARALLAYAVALAAAGRSEAALFAALSALARAREAQDPQGEHACARFLARLCDAAGYVAAAGVWLDAAARAGAEAD
jgi:hypothetical protein